MLLHIVLLRGLTCVIVCRRKYKPQAEFLSQAVDAREGRGPEIGQECGFLTNNAFAGLWDVPGVAQEAMVTAGVARV